MWKKLSVSCDALNDMRLLFYVCLVSKVQTTVNTLKHCFYSVHQHYWVGAHLWYRNGPISAHDAAIGAFWH